MEPNDPGFITADMPGLDLAFQIQGGLHSPVNLRTDAGVYVYHDVKDYLSRNQTYWVQQVATLDTTGGAATALSTSFPSGGLRFGRYLVGISVLSTTLANLTGGVIAVNSAGSQTDFPSIGNEQAIATFGLTNARTFGTVFIPVLDQPWVRFPLWMPPASYLTLYITSSAASGIYTLRALWASTEQLTQTGTPRTPTGQLRAPVKI